MEKGFLLNGRLADRLYREYAAELPIIDYHNHLSISALVNDERYDNITDLWISADPYKHRLLRMVGTEERIITGECDPFERFSAFCTAFPMLCGSAVYDFSVLELHRIFGVDDLPCADNARYLYDKLNEQLRSPEFSAKGLLRSFGVEYLSPVRSLTDEVEGHDGVAPSLRGDDLLRPTAALIKTLSAITGRSISTVDDYLDAVDRRLLAMCSSGCRFSDHSLDDGFTYALDDGKNEERFVRSVSGTLPTGEENALASYILRRLSALYAREKMTMLLHIGAKRHTSDRLRRLAGATGGYAGVGSSPTPSSIGDALGDMERHGGLPSTVLCPLNMADMPPLATLGGSFLEDGVSGKVGLGPAWWWCDHSYGIRATLDAQSSFGLLSEFIGMTTDSRSILSFSRHEYFRRIFCSYLAELSEAGHAPKDERLLCEIIKKVCYTNAKNRVFKKN